MFKAHWPAAAAGIAVLVATCAVSSSSRAGSSRLAVVTPEGLRDDFDADLRNVVYRWDRRDPRPPHERQKALFDFVYQTYDSSAWIPQSLFDGNLVTQAVVGDVDTHRPRQGRPGAVARTTRACRRSAWRRARDVDAAAQVDGQLPGLPHRRDRRRRLLRRRHEAVRRQVAGRCAQAADERRVAARACRRTQADRTHAADAHRILTSHHHDKIDSLTRGRSTAFAASHVELYMRPHNGRMPAVDEVGRGDVKTPPLWHTAAKMQRGRWYADGSFHGRIPLMASSMELEKDRSFDALVDDGHSAHQGGVRHRGAPPAAAAVSVRDRSRSRGARARALLLEARSAAPGVTASTTGRATSTGRACTPTSARTARVSTSCRTRSSTRSTTARLPRRARW